MIPAPHRSRSDHRIARRHASGRLFRALFAPAPRRTFTRPHRRCRRLWLEPLEDRTLLSASILGTVRYDLTGKGNDLAGAQGVANTLVYQDLNGNGALDTKTSTIQASGSSLTLAAAPSASFDGGTDQFASMNVSGLASATTKVTVKLDLTMTGPGPVEVDLVGPRYGSAVPTGATLFFLEQGDHYSVTLDEQAATRVSQATPSGGVFSGTFAPDGSFTTPAAHVYDGDPNGRWGLLFRDPTSSGSPVTGITINSWSLNFTVPTEPFVLSDANGNYSFTGLSAGTYALGVVPAAGATVTSPANGATQHVSVAANQTVSGVDFGVHDGPTLGAATAQPNVDITSGEPTVQQMPSIAVDPKDPTHLVAAYMDYGLQDTTSAAPVSAGSATVTPVASGFSAVVGEKLIIDQGLSNQETVTVTAATGNTFTATFANSHAAGFGISTGYAGLGVAVSHDSGATWARTSIPLPAKFNEAAGQPVVQFDAQGHVYVAFMAATFLGPDPGLIYDTGSVAGVQERSYGMQANNGIFVARSTDDGTTWATPVAVDSNLYAGTKVPFDAQPDFAIDTSPSSPHAGNLYVVWTRFYPIGQFPGHPTATKTGTEVMIAVSGNGGQNWQTRTQSNSSAESSGLTTLFNEFGQTPNTVLDPGAASAQVSTIQDPLVGIGGFFAGSAYANAEGRGSETLPRVSVGPGGVVYVSLWAGGRFPVLHSSDAGKTFSVPDAPRGEGYPFGTEVTLPNGVPGNFPIPAPFLAAANGNDQFRTQAVRDIVADPARPGHLYAVESVLITDPTGGNLLDAGEIDFSRSDDYGVTWQTVFTVGPNTLSAPGMSAQFLNAFRPALNDDDGTRFLMFAQGLVNEVVSGQALPEMTVDAQGNIGIIWYDTRRDPAGSNLDVFGISSTDGGHTFSPNYRLSDASFDPSAGAFTDARGNTSLYLGDHIGLAAAGGNAYAVWTGVSASGGQDVYFQRYNLTTPPPPAVERFEPNSTRQTATDLGQVLVQQVVPRLALAASDEDWFKAVAGATGDFIVTATAPTAGNLLQVELWDATGTVLLATGTPVTDSTGAVIGERVSVSGASGTTYLIHVFGGVVPSYSLTLQSLTADLGSTVQADKSATVTAGGQADYRLVAAVTGQLNLTLTPGSGFQGTLQVLSSDGQTVLATGHTVGATQQASVSVTQGQVVLLQVSNTGTTSGTFDLSLVNLDQWETSPITSLFLPTSGNASGLAAADLTGNKRDDLVVTSNQFSDAVSVLLTNPDGTFQAARQLAAGPGDYPTAVRQPAVADLTGNGIPDLIIPNYLGDTVSVLLGRGDGTYLPARTFDAVRQPDSVVVGDFNGDGHLDLAVLGRIPGSTQVAILFGRGDGTFRPPVITTVPGLPAGDSFPVLAGDLTGNGRDDLVVFSANDASFDVLLSNGNGTFTNTGPVAIGESPLNAQLADLDGRHDAHGKPILDLVIAGGNNGDVYVLKGNGDGTFQAPTAVSVTPVPAGDNVAVVGLAVTSYGSPAGTTRANLVVTTRSRLGSEPPQLFLLPNDGKGNFGTPQLLATLQQAGQVVSGDFTGKGSADIAFTDAGGVRVIYGNPPAPPANITKGAARDLGTTFHLVSPPQAIVASHENSYFRYTVPTEPSSTADEVIDFSALFQDVQGAGLQMEVTDAAGHVLGSGARFQVRAAQGEQLFIHIFGRPATAKLAQGAGVYTLDVDVLPQVVSVQSQSLFPGVGTQPGGPVNSLVITFQGDLLDTAAAQNPSHYRVVLLPPGGGPASAGQVLPLAQSVIYAPQTDLRPVVSGLAYPSAVQSTVTLVFAQPLAPGSYEIDVLPTVQAAAFNVGESDLLAGGGAFTEHPVVSVSGATINEGDDRQVSHLVRPASHLGSFESFAQGTPFLTQLQNDLAALLAQLVAQHADDATITAALNEAARQLIETPDGPPGNRLSSFLLIWLDPVGFDMVDPGNQRVTYNTQQNAVASDQPKTFVEVGGTVELLVVANAAGLFSLSVSDVPPAARGGALALTENGTQTVALTEGLQGGQRNFTFDLGESAATAVASAATASGGLGSSAAALAATGESSGSSGTAVSAAGLATLLILGVQGEVGATGEASVAANAAAGSPTGLAAGATAAGLGAVGIGAGAEYLADQPGGLALLDEVYRGWAAPVAAEALQFGGLAADAVAGTARTALSALKSVEVALGLEDMPLPELPAEALADVALHLLRQAGRNVSQALTDFLTPSVRPANIPGGAAPIRALKRGNGAGRAKPSGGGVAPAFPPVLDVAPAPAQGDDEALAPPPPPGAPAAGEWADRDGALRGAVVAAVFAAGAWQGVGAGLPGRRLLRRLLPTRNRAGREERSVL
jgi:hypothetical protein